MQTHNLNVSLKSFLRCTVDSKGILSVNSTTFQTVLCFLIFLNRGVARGGAEGADFLIFLPSITDYCKLTI